VESGASEPVPARARAASAHRSRAAAGHCLLRHPRAISRQIFRVGLAKEGEGTYTIIGDLVPRHEEKARNSLGKANLRASRDKEEARTEPRRSGAIFMPGTWSSVVVPDPRGGPAPSAVGLHTLHTLHTLHLCARAKYGRPNAKYGRRWRAAFTGPGHASTTSCIVLHGRLQDRGPAEAPGMGWGGRAFVRAGLANRLGRSLAVPNSDPHFRERY
jgi:hypothetical protein